MAVQRWRLPCLEWKELPKYNMSKTECPQSRYFYKADHLPSQGVDLKGWVMPVTMTFP